MNPRLVLLPADPEELPEDLPGMQAALRQLGLMGQVTNQPDVFFTGEAFLQLLIFLGCSPQINLSPQDGDKYCTVRFHQSPEQTTCMGHTTAMAPICPKCKTKHRNWQQIAGWQLGQTQSICPHCQGKIPMAQYHWRKQGGYGRFSIQVSQIYPHEAVPADALMDTLQQLTDSKWGYFYASDEDTV